MCYQLSYPAWMLLWMMLAIRSMWGKMSSLNKHDDKVKKKYDVDCKYLLATKKGLAYLTILTKKNKPSPRLTKVNDIDPSEVTK